MSTRISTLTVPNDPAHIELVLTYCEAVSALAGFSGEEAAEISEALKEACENVITHAFDPYEHESFTVQFEIFCDGLKINIDDKGLPYSSKLVKKNQDTPGLSIIEAKMDRVTYINRGRDGKELQLVKYLKGKHVDEIFTNDELTPYTVCELPPTDFDCTIRPMRPEEAVQVSKCIYKTYKYTYLNEDLYFPERIERMNREKRMHSYVAVTGKGEVIAHFALVPRPNARVARIGIAVVTPRYRRKGLMKKLLERMLDDATELGFTALYGDAVSMHTMSQRTNLQYDFQETAIQLGELPPGSVQLLKGLEGAGNLITFFKFLKEAEEYDVYLPASHKKMLTNLYSRLGVKRNCINGAHPPLPKESEIHLTIDKCHKTATIEIITYGWDVEKRLMAKLVGLEGKGLNTQYLDLRLKDPYTPKACSIFEGLGFIFSGLLPEYSDGDILRLQHYHTKVRYDEIETYSLFSSELLSYIKGLDPKWKALAE